MLRKRYRFVFAAIGTVITCSLCSGLAIGTSSPKQTVLACGQLIDGKHETPIRNVLITVQGEHIESVSPETEIPAGVDGIDLRSSTCLPGLIDAHVHPLIATDDYQIDHLRHSSGYKALRALKVLQEMLEAGWTSVRIAGDADVYYAHLDAKKAIEDGMFVGPRVTGAGHYLSITGGGGDINFFGPEHAVLADGLVVDGVAEIRKAVRKEVKYGSDWIKVLASGAFMSAGDDPTRAHFSPEELKTLVDEANRLGAPVMAHAHSSAGIKQAVLAGARSIEHGTFVDEEGLQMMKEHGVYLVPTLTVDEYNLEEQGDSEALKKAIELYKQFRSEHHKRVKRAIELGVMVAVGSDYVGGPVTFGMREFRLLANLGMTAMEAIQAGTSVNARLLGWDDRVGSIEPGKLADIIAVPSDPLADLTQLQKVSFVMLGGKVIRSE